MKTLYYFAQAAYGEGQYGDGLYSCTQQQEDQGICTVAAGAGTDGTGSGNSGSLTNTGIAVIGIVSLACLLIFAALVVRIWRRPRLAAVSDTDNVSVPESVRSNDSQ